MDKAIADFKTDTAPWQVKLVGVFLLIVALAVFTSYWWISIILLLTGVLLLTWHSGVEIDLINRTFREYNSYFLYKTGIAEKFDAIEKVYINQSTVSQTMYTAHTSSSSTFRNIVFNAWLKFNDTHKIFLGNHRNKEKLIKSLNSLLMRELIELDDYTIE
ncbi:MAG: hypothetical protein JJU28_15000 [Cyclobacteriaceae bacterium]|nr:hypothetical protein [Cyclobacteriaceae bacterium]